MKYRLYRYTETTIADDKIQTSHLGTRPALIIVHPWYAQIIPEDDENVESFKMIIEENFLRITIEFFGEFAIKQYDIRN